MRARLDQRSGIGAVEVIVGMILLAVALAAVMLAIPRGRESARQAGCRRNLMQIGMALNLYHQAGGSLPTATLDGPSPLATLLDGLGVPDFRGLKAETKVPIVANRPAIEEHPIFGFTCPSDAPSSSRVAVSYRAITGDTTDGRDGAFALGRRITIPEIEAADGASYTVAFAERRIGRGGLAVPDDPANYALVAPPIDAIPPAPIGPGDWRADAGSSWLTSDWRSTLANASRPPGSAESRIATDRKTATMGASSEHPTGLNALRVDGSVETIRPGIDLTLWRRLATTGIGPP